jgi:hypothetical protein
VVHLDESLCVDGIRVTGQLVNLSVYLFPDVPKEIFLAGRLCREFFCDVEILGTRSTLELPEYNHLVRLGDQQRFIFTSFLDCSKFGVALEELSKHLFPLVDEDALHR